MAAAILGIGCVGSLLLAPGVAAQAQDLLLESTDTWRVRRDEGSRGDPARVVRDAKGLSVRTGASSILYRPDVELHGSYRVEVAFALFDPEGRNEGFGLVFGGSDLSGADQSYGYALIRQDGWTLIKRRAGDETAVVRDWIEGRAVEAWSERPAGQDFVVNTLTLDVTEGKEMRIEVNGEPIHSSPADAMETRGVIGLRVNHGVSIRVERFTVERR